MSARPAIMGRPVMLTVSIGVGQFDPATMSNVELIQVADEALYTAKNGGRNRAFLASTTTAGQCLAVGSV